MKKKKNLRNYPDQWFSNVNMAYYTSDFWVPHLWSFRFTRSRVGDKGKASEP